jgi:surface antigen
VKALVLNSLSSIYISLNPTPTPIQQKPLPPPKPKPIPAVVIPAPEPIYYEPEPEYDPEPVYEPKPVYRGNVPIYNNYFSGECVWYAFERRLALGNPVPAGLGNASTWLYRAQNFGYETGSEPRAGAVIWFYPGDTLGHVGIVEYINYDGSVHISEMNVKGHGIISERDYYGAAMYIY